MIGVCRECGCTDRRPCIIEIPREPFDHADARIVPCSWVERDLCSACSPVVCGCAESYPQLQPWLTHGPTCDHFEAPILFDAYGNPWSSST